MENAVTAMPRVFVEHSLIAILSMLLCTSAFQISINHGGSLMHRVSRGSQLFSSVVGSDLIGVSRLDTLQALLGKWGAPGSKGCSEKEDLQPISSVDGTEMLDLHPLLIPIAQSSKTGNLVCALKTSALDVLPSPIVESRVGAPGYKLLALNSEHLMRRIACEADATGQTEFHDIVNTYNEGLGQGLLQDKGLDTPYEQGAVEKLGYGVEKFVLLRVGPFPDLYQAMSSQHTAKGDESSALIAAEAANGKFNGFGSSYLSYARLLSTFPNRDEESRDAARICLRLPISSNGMENDDLKTISILAGIADKNDTYEDAMSKMLGMYEKIRESEKEEEGSQASGRTPEQIALDEATYLLDRAAMAGKSWSSVRSDLAEIYGKAQRNDMAAFVDTKRFQ